MSTTTPIRLFLDAHVFDGEYQGSRTFISDLYTELSKTRELQLYIGAYNIEKLKHYLDNTTHILVATNELGPDSAVQNPFEVEHYFEFVIQDLYDGRITKIYL